MANRSDRGREQPAVMSRALKPAKQNGTSSAETIRASGHDRANRSYTRLHPDKARQTFKDPLATREPSTQDSGSAILRQVGETEARERLVVEDKLSPSTRTRSSRPFFWNSAAGAALPDVRM